MLIALYLWTFIIWQRKSSFCLASFLDCLLYAVFKNYRPSAFCANFCPLTIFTSSAYCSRCKTLVAVYWMHFRMNLVCIKSFYPRELNNGNVTVFKVYGWRHSDVVVIKLIAVFRIEFPTKRIFQIFNIWKTDTMALFCNLFIERPS